MLHWSHSATIFSRRGVIAKPDAKLPCCSHIIATSVNFNRNAIKIDFAYHPLLDIVRFNVEIHNVHKDEITQLTVERFNSLISIWSAP